MRRGALALLLLAASLLALGEMATSAAKGKARGFLINRYLNSPYYNAARPRQGNALESQLKGFHRTNPAKIETFNSQLRSLETRKPGVFSSGQSFGFGGSADELKGTLFDRPRWKKLFPETQDWKRDPCENPADCGAQPQQSNAPDSDDNERPEAPQPQQQAMCVTENMTCEIEQEKQFTRMQICVCIDETTIEAGLLKLQPQ